NAFTQVIDGRILSPYSRPPVEDPSVPRNKRPTKKKTTEAEAPPQEHQPEEAKEREDEVAEAGSDDDEVIVGEIAEESDPAGTRPEPVVDKGERGIGKFDPFAAYFSEIQRHALLTPDEEHSLAVKYSETQDVKAAARLVTANLRLVVKIAYEYRRAYRNI